MAMRIAVTGATGFVGRHLSTAARDQGWACDVLDRARYDPLDADQLCELVSGKDAVIHLAAVQRSDDVGVMNRANVLGTKALLDAVARVSPDAVFVFASSFQVYRPVSPFAHSKILAEELIRGYGKGPGAFTNSVILRFTNIYGVGGTPFTNSVIATFAHQAKRGLPIRVNGDGNQRRDYLHVSDAVTALMRAAQTRVRRAETVDICSGRQITLNAVLEMMGRYNGAPLAVEYDTGAGQDDWPFQKDYQDAKRLLGWEPRVPLEAGLKELFTNGFEPVRQ